MTNDKTQPCLRRIDADCFRARPAWAKQAFAYRLVHLLTPKALTKRLPKGLRTALLAPGVVMPPGVELPPGVVVGPGGEIPAGWTPGDPLPPGAIAPGETPPGTDATGITPPTFVAPGEPGPVTPPGGHIPVPAGLWFDEPFSNLTANSWDDISSGTGSATIVAGTLKLHNPLYADHSAIERYDARDWPVNWQLEIKVNIDQSNSENRYTFYTGTYRTGIRFYATNQIRLEHSFGTDNKTVPDFAGQNITWLLDITGNAVDVYRDGNLVWEYTDYPSDASFAGRMWLDVRGNSTTYTDSIKITAM